MPSRIPFLIILNKIDLPGAMREEEILEVIHNLIEKVLELIWTLKYKIPKKI